MPKPNILPENATPEDYLLAAARRLIAARENPKLDWGQKKAVEEEALAFHTLIESVKLYDVAPKAPAKKITAKKIVRQKAAPDVHIEVFNISSDGHKIFVANGKKDFVAEGDIEQLLSPRTADAYAKAFKCSLEDILVTEYDLYDNDAVRASNRVTDMSAEEAYAIVKEFKVKPYYRKRPWLKM